MTVPRRSGWLMRPDCRHKNQDLERCICRGYQIDVNVIIKWGTDSGDVAFKKND
jgi:hypothetical protein